MVPNRAKRLIVPTFFFARFGTISHLVLVFVLLTLSIYLLKVNNTNTKTRCEKSSKLIIKTGIDSNVLRENVSPQLTLKQFRVGIRLRVTQIFLLGDEDTGIPPTVAENLLIPLLPDKT